MALLELRGVSKSFGDFKAVDKVSFSMDEGSIFGLIGPNGAGKTTTIRMIVNIIMPDSGEIKFLGGNIAADQIGYLPEERGLYKKMFVEELLVFMAKLKSMKTRDAKEQINYWFEKFQINDWRKKKIEELSKGMQQKIQFVSTILHKPKLLILDEPFGGLDPINVNLIKDVILELKEKGTTIIFSTHVMESAEKICDDILLINKGKVVLSGKLSDVKENYRKRNVLIIYEGRDDFIKQSSEIEKFNNYGHYVELQLKEEGDAQKILKQAVQDNVIIRKFEIKEPSLNEIFMEAVGADKEEGGDHE
jgi:ABC-2 type transport system ATP-binding protein